MGLAVQWNSPKSSGYLQRQLRSIARTSSVRDNVLRRDLPQHRSDLCLGVPVNDHRDRFDLDQLLRLIEYCNAAQRTERIVIGELVTNDLSRRRQNQLAATMPSTPAR